MVIHNKGGEDPQKATDGAEEGEGQAFGLDGAVFAVIEEDQGTGQHEEGGRSPKRVGLAHPSIAPYGVFRTSDGAPILISIQSDREWRVFARAFLEAPELGDDPRFAANVARVRHRGETDAVVAAAFARRDRAAALEALTRADTAFAELNDMAALSRHPHLRRITVATPSGPVAYPAPAAIFKGETRVYGPAPALGETTSEVP